MVRDLLRLLLPIALLGVVLFGASRWARTRNRNLKRQHGGFLSSDAPAALYRRGDVSQFLRLTFLGDASPFEERLGRLLALAVILCVTASLCLLIFIIARHELQ
jgi:hypothetical protein